jgi:hypothetical protein
MAETVKKIRLLCFIQVVAHSRVAREESQDAAIVGVSEVLQVLDFARNGLLLMVFLAN